MVKLIVMAESARRPQLSPENVIVTFEEVKQWLKSGRLVRHFFRYPSAEMLIYRLDTFRRPFQLSMLLRLLSRGKISIRDDQGKTLNLNFSLLVQLAWRFLRDAFQLKTMIAAHEQAVAQYLQKPLPASTSALDLSLPPLYLRTDMVFGLQAGGMIAHMLGLVNTLDKFITKPIVATTDYVPAIRPDIEVHVVPLTAQFWDYPEALEVATNMDVIDYLQQKFANTKFSFVYQRYSMNNYAGLMMAHHYQIPFVLEYNGSEVWIQKHWRSVGLRNENLTESIEMLNLKAADVIVVVSQPSKDELIQRGIDPAKILVNPNGVDPNIYSPDIDRIVIRQRYEMEGKTVVGFIGTFGPWHGAEVLAKAYGELLTQYPKYRENTRLLLIGNGLRMPAVKEILEQYKVLDFSVLTGAVPQAESPMYLAACDIFSLPHVPNPDGSKFFGSPTKLFEYMAMGKTIIASDLDQIGDILKHDQTAWMVEPSNPIALMTGLKGLIDNPVLRQRLGEGSRQQVVTNYTWQHHTGKIIDFLKDRTQ